MSARGRLRVLADGSPLCDDRRTAGIGRYVDRLTAALQARDDVRLRVAVPRRPPLRNSWVVRWLHAQPRLLAEAVIERPRLVHAMASEPAAGWPLWRQVVTVHDVVPWEPGYARPGSHLAAYLGWQARRFRRCAAVIAVSRTVATEAIARLDLDPGHVHIVPEGVDEVFTADPAPEDDVLRRSAGVDGARYLLWVGSLVSPDPRKGLDVLLDALAGLDGAPRLVLVGRTGEAGERLTAEARSRGVPIHLTGWVDDAALAALYRGCAAVVVPSRHEGFGLPALEGMACGAPVIAATSGNLTELVGDAAMLVPPGDAAALRYALRSLLDDGTTRHRLARAGPPRAAPFRWERAAELTVAVYAAAQRAPAHPA